jgi:hypothetical protein
MEDTNQGIETNQTPGILDIKPVEELPTPSKPNDQKSVEKIDENAPGLEKKQQKLEEFDAEEIEFVNDLVPEDIFVRSTPKPKKKKEISEKQRAHMEKMRVKRAEKALLKKQEQEAAEEAKLQARLAQMQANVDRQRSRTQAPKTAPKPKKSAENVIKSESESNVGGGGGGRKDDRMDDFLKQMSEFMDEYKSQKKAPVRKAPKPRAKPKPPERDSNDTYFVDFLRPQVSYGNYQNPFGM